ncbi:MAG: CPBP family intramembrane metalloprotease [Clostridiales bacterium]|nr:CPBP family intramembrane metalloprotease [Clostridiales bacterium]
METKKKDLLFFVILTYVLFYISLGMCLVIAAFGVPMESISKYAPVVISWVSLAVLMIWAKRLLKGSSRKEFLKGLFAEKLKIKWVLISIIIPSAVFAITVIVLSVVDRKPVGELINRDYASFPLLFVLQLLMGPTAEEPGWRGYFFTEVSAERGILKGSVITGLVWGLWHTPLWLMEGFSPLNLVIYAVSFMGAVIGISIIIGYIYGKHRNLIYCTIIHLLFNFLNALVIIDQNRMPFVVVIYAVLYLLIAAVMILINRTTSRRNEIQ